MARKKAQPAEDREEIERTARERLERQQQPSLITDEEEPTKNDQEDHQEEEETEPGKMKGTDMAREIIREMGGPWEKDCPASDIAKKIRARYERDVAPSSISSTNKKMWQKQTGGADGEEKVTRRRHDAPSSAPKPALQIAELFALIGKIKAMADARGGLLEVRKMIDVIEEMADEVGGFDTLKQCVDALTAMNIK